MADNIRLRTQIPVPRVRLRVLPSLLPTNAAVAVGTVTTLSPGLPATVVNVGTPQNPILDFGIPTGSDGLVQAIVEGNGVTVNTADPHHPVVGLRDWLTPKDFGAIADGIEDDTAAIVAADAAAAAAGMTLYFPDGVYAANALTMTTGWHMAPGAKLLFNGATEGEVLRCSAAGIVSGDIHIDCNGLEPLTGLYLSGNGNTFGTVTVKNVISSNQAWVVRSIYMIGNDNRIGTVFLNDLVNTGNTNDSSPQGLVLSGSATENITSNVFSNNCRSSVVENSTGRNQFGDINAVACKDNGFYCVGTGCNTVVGSITYDGDDTALGVRHNASISVGEIHVLRSGTNAIFFGDCADVTIGDIFVHNLTTLILYLNLANTGAIKIGSIRGTLYNSAAFFMPQGGTYGDVKSLTIDEVDLSITLDSSNTLSTRSMFHLQGVHGLNIGRFKANIVLLGGYAPVTPFYVRINNALTYASKIDSMKLGLFQADGVTPYIGAAFQLVGYDGTTDGPCVQSNLWLGEGIITTVGRLDTWTAGTFQSSRLVASAIPTVGTWRTGAVLWAGPPTSGTALGWVCTAGGTPGTWAPFLLTDQGSYTPTLFNTTNVASSTAALSYWYRVGDRVHVFGSLAATGTAAGSAATLLGVSIPVATTFSSFRMLSGAGVLNTGTARLAVQIQADTTNNRASFFWYSSNTSSVDITFEFSYRV